MTRTDLEYRRTNAQAASGIGLLITMFDTLAGDLRRAAEAERRNDIETRCRELGHALLVIGHLEDWINRGPGGDLARQLIAFYGSLRRKLIEAEAARSPELLEQQVNRVLELRAQWQQLEMQPEADGPEILRPTRLIPPGYPDPRANNSRGNWCA
jgi:flagellar protein FliS